MLFVFCLLIVLYKTFQNPFNDLPLVFIRAFVSSWFKKSKREMKHFEFISCQLLNSHAEHMFLLIQVLVLYHFRTRCHAFKLHDLIVKAFAVFDNGDTRAAYKFDQP